MGGRGSDSMNRLLNGGRKPKAQIKKITKWKRTTVTVKGQSTPAYSNGGRYAVYKDAGDRYRVYDTKTETTVDAGKGATLTFNKLKDAIAYASK